MLVVLQGPTDTRKLTLTGPQDVELHILPVGAVVQRLYVRDRSGERRDVALGFDTVTPYEVIRLKPRTVLVRTASQCLKPVLSSPLVLYMLHPSGFLHLQ